MIQKIDLIEDKSDQKQLKIELKNIFEGTRKAIEGFLQIALAANRIKEKKLYLHLGFTTFERFCIECIELSRKQVNLYIRIAEITINYGELFNEEFVSILGPRKMDEISKGINIIENSHLSRKEKRKKIIEIARLINPELTVAETEQIVKKHTRLLKPKK